MDETIGVKGGYQDRIRSFKIKKEQQKKLQELQEEKEIQELEKEVQKKQRFVLVRALPIVIAGEVFQILYDTATGRKRINKQVEYSKWKIKEYDADFTTKARGEKDKTKEVTIVLTDGRKVNVTLPPVEEKKTILPPLEEKPIVVKDEKIEHKMKTHFSIPEDTVSMSISNDENHFPVASDTISLPKSEDKEFFSEEKLSDEFTPFLTEQGKETFEKLRNRKIIDEYEKQLKDIRYELRNLVFEYNVLEEENQKLLLSKDAEILLDKLSDVIRKMERLKEKIQIDHLEEYDDNYVYVLIEEYLQEFHDKKIVSDMKDSPLYVLISDKIDEILNKKNHFQQEVKEKKDAFEEKEERFERLKEKYYQFDKINKELLSFQDEQDRILRDVQEKVRKSTSVKERVEVQVEAMNRQSRRMLRLLSLSMFLPGNRSARSLASSTAAYLYFARNIMRPKTVTKRYRVIQVQDYHQDIEYSISAIEDATLLLERTDKQLDEIIREIRLNFQEYIGVLPECDELLANLEKIKSDLHEKEYEMEKTKREQEALLELNDQKVLKRGEYPM